MSINPRYILLVDKLSNEASIKMRLSFAMSWKKCKREKRGKRQRHSDQNQVFLMKNMQKMMRQSNEVDCLWTSFYGGFSSLKALFVFCYIHSMPGASSRALFINDPVYCHLEEMAMKEKFPLNNNKEKRRKNRESNTPKWQKHETNQSTAYRFCSPFQLESLLLQP